jgi:hypothetical protein
MNSESIKKVTDQAVDQLVQALNAGQNEALTRYLGAMAKFRTYSFLSVLLILKTRPNARRVAGYKTWHSFGRLVKQGEKGILILAPMFRKTPETPERKQKLPPHRAGYPVCARSTSGMNSKRQVDLPQIGTVTGDPSSYLQRLEQLVRAGGIRLEYSAGVAPARGMATNGHMTLLPDLTPAETFATLVYECAFRHALRRASRRYE